MVARPWSSPRLSCGEHLLLRWDGNAGNSFSTPEGKGHSSRARKRKRGSSGCGRDSLYSSRVETCMSRTLEKEMATHSSTFAWKIPWTEEPGGLQSISKGSFTPLPQLKKFPDIPVSTREEARDFLPHPEEPRFCLLPREEGSFPCVVGKEFPAFPSHLKRRR